MIGKRSLGDVKARGDLSGRHRALLQKPQYFPSLGICYSPEYRFSHSQLSILIDIKIPSCNFRVKELVSALRSWPCHLSSMAGLRVKQREAVVQTTALDDNGTAP
jgi:hypothetical protein